MPLIDPAISRLLAPRESDIDALMQEVAEATTPLEPTASPSKKKPNPPKCGRARKLRSIPRPPLTDDPDRAA